jgi:hypothetical protein
MSGEVTAGLFLILPSRDSILPSKMNRSSRIPTHRILAAIMLFGATGRAQSPDSLVDVMPLTVGNRWIYSYELRQTGGIEDPPYLDEASGSLELKITGSGSAGDTAIWYCTREEIITHHIVKGWQDFDTTYVVHILKNVEIREILTGQHSLTWGNGAPLVLYPYLPASQVIKRYQSVDSSGDVIVEGLPFYSTYGQWSMFSRNIGLVFEINQVTRYYGHEESATLVSSIIAGVDQVPSGFTLEQNYPNPFNSLTTVKYTLPGNEYVSLTIFNVIGQRVAEPVREFQEPGYKTVTFDAGNLPSGVYTYRITAGDFTDAKKMLLIK